MSADNSAKGRPSGKTQALVAAHYVSYLTVSRGEGGRQPIQTAPQRLRGVFGIQAVAGGI